MSDAVTTLRAIAVRLCRPHTLHRIVEPLLGDLRHERDHSRRVDGQGGSTWFWIAATFTLTRAVVAYESLRGLAWLASVARGDHPDATRLGRLWLAAFAVVVTALAGWPGAIMVTSGATLSPRAAALLVPQAIPYGLAGALTIAVLLSGRTALRLDVRRLVFAAAIASSLTSFCLLAWAVPNANQMFRVEVAGRSLPPGPNELSIADLHRRLDVVRDVPWQEWDDAYREYLVSLHTRWAVPASCVLLPWAATILCRRVRLGRTALGGIGTVAIAAHMTSLLFLQGMGHSGHLHPALAVWLPNLTVLLALPALSQAPEHPAVP